MTDSQAARWQDRLWARWDGSPAQELGALAVQFADEQQRHWPRLAEGRRALRASRMRELQCGGYAAWLQYNPQRMASTGARVDAATIAARPCFLCWQQLPPQQKAILYRNEYLLLCNPAPIFAEHFTVARVAHVAQQFDQVSRTLLQLAYDLGKSFTVFYNGPRCGASAPDHLHLQACPAGAIPLERQLWDGRHRSGGKRVDGVDLSMACGLDRGLLVLEGRVLEEVHAVLRRSIDQLPRPVSDGGPSLQPQGPPEPMMNILCHHTSEVWRVVLIPRRKHRPDAYSLPEATRQVISPAAVDVGGLVVTPREADFRGVSPSDLTAIFREVTYDETAVAAMLAGTCRGAGDRIQHRAAEFLDGGNSPMSGNR